MTPGRAARLGLLAWVLAVGVTVAAEPASEVRVLSTPGGPTVITVQATPSATIEDHTAGAKPAAEGQGAASTGETFSDEISFVVRGWSLARQGAIEVTDALVSTVRLFPDPAGTQVVVFVRQPVGYEIDRPSATGAVRIVLHPRTMLPPPVMSVRQGLRSPGKRPPAEGEDQVAVDAAELSYDQQNNVLTARGGVTLTRGLTTLRADEVRYDRNNHVAEAHGHVVLVDPEATVEGDAARLDLDDETGWMTAVTADMRQSPFHLSADRIEKHGGPCYTAERGIFTTCHCGGIEKPEWSIKSDSTDVNTTGMGVAKDATFRVEDVPVLWAPLLPFPANNERQTGFLLPRFGYSNKRGFLLEQPFYWAINKSSDLTITPDLETAARVGIINEYRYRLSKDVAGIITGGYFNERIGGSPEPIQPIGSATVNAFPPPENRWIVASRNEAKLTPDAYTWLEVLRISDNNFLREIRAFSTNVRSDIQVRSTRFTRSELGGLQTWDGGALRMTTTGYQDLIDPQKFALNELPRIDVEHGIPILDGLAVARMTGEVADFQREKGYDGMRLDLAPELWVPFGWGPYFSGALRGQLRETAYHLTDTEPVGVFSPNNNQSNNVTFNRAGRLTSFTPGSGLVPPDLDTNHSREIGELNGRVGTEFGRTYDFPHLGLDKIRHTIEPEVQYLYVPHVETNFLSSTGLARVEPSLRGIPGTFFSEGYLFDEVDAIRKRNFVSYGVTTRVLGRGAVAAPAPTPAALSEETAMGMAEPLTVGDEEEDEALDEVDPDTLPQGLPAETLPPTPKSPKGTPPPVASVPGSRELVHASLLQGYDFSRQLTPSSNFSDVDAIVRLTPLDWAGFTYGTSVDVSRGHALSQTVGLVLRDPTWTPPTDRPNFQNSTTIGVAYHFIASHVNESFATNAAQQHATSANPVEGIDGAFYLRLTDYIGAGFLARYSLADTLAPDRNDPNKVHTIGPGFLERDLFVRLISRCNCWIVEAGVSDRTDTNDTTFRVQFTLFGLGALGSSPASRGYAQLAGLQNLGFHRPSPGGYP